MGHKPTPKKLEYLIAGMSIKLRIYVQNGKPVADFSGVDLENRPMTVEVLNEIRDAFDDAFMEMHWMAKEVANGSK